MSAPLQQNQARRERLHILRAEFSRRAERLRPAYASKMSAKGILAIIFGVVVLGAGLLGVVLVPKVPVLALVLISWIVPSLMSRVGIPGGLRERLIETHQNCYELLYFEPPLGRSLAQRIGERLRDQPVLGLPAAARPESGQQQAAQLLKFCRDFERSSGVSLLDRRPVQAAWLLLAAFPALLIFWALLYTGILPLAEVSAQLGACLAGLSFVLFGSGYALFMYWHGLLRAALELALRDLLDDQLEQMDSGSEPFGYTAPARFLGDLTQPWE